MKETKEVRRSSTSENLGERGAENKTEAANEELPKRKKSDLLFDVIKSDAFKSIVSSRRKLYGNWRYLTILKLSLCNIGIFSLHDK